MKTNITKNIEKTKKDKKKLFSGVLTGHARGFAFLGIDGEEEDIFIPRNSLNGAMHGDTVVVELTDEKAWAGRVCSITKRGVINIVGTFSRQGAYGFVIPDDRRYFSDIFIAKENAEGIKSRTKVVVKIIGFPEDRRNPEGIIIEKLGKVGQAGVDILSIIRAHGFTESFTNKTVSEAMKIPSEVPEKDLQGREDFREKLIITIDGEDARDLDDAVSVERTSDGFILGVYIADVTHYVKHNSSIDKEAMERATSVYFPDRVLPMLPSELSNGICSLNCGKTRLTLACIIKLSDFGKVKDVRITEGVIKTRERMTYTDCNLILDGDKALSEKYSHVVPMLKDMEKLAKLLNDKRNKRGAVDFDLPEAKIILDENGDVEEIKAYERGVSNHIIEEFMLIANECIAEYAKSIEDLPFVYRVHETPDTEKIEVLAEYLENLGARVRFNNELKPRELQAVLNTLKGKDCYSAASKVALRSMKKARYATACLGHFGLAAEFYCHFTSPIRRYPDLAIHRILKHIIKKGTVGVDRFLNFAEETAKISSMKEKAAEEAEREVDDLKKAEYMQRFIGEVFEGVISGVTSFGVFVELPNTVEGLIRLENLPDDRYFFDERKFRLVGGYHKFGLGDRIKVAIAGVDLVAKKVEFCFPNEDED